MTSSRGKNLSPITPNPDTRLLTPDFPLPECSLTSTCFQGLAAFLEQPNSLEESKQPNLLKLTPTHKLHCDRDSQAYPYTQTSATIPPIGENSISRRWDFLVQGQAPLDCVPDLTTQNQPCGLKHCGALQTVSPASSSSKILQGLSVADYEQFLEDSEWSAIVGTIHKSYQLRNSERRRRGKDFSLLPTPTTYAKGSGKCRPAGATKLEQRLRQFITPGDKLHPGVPGWMMGFPAGWVEETLMDGGLAIQLPEIVEYVAIPPSAESVIISTLDLSCQKSQRSPSDESCICPSCEQPLINLGDGCGVCGWMRSQLTESAVLMVDSPVTVSTRHHRAKKGFLYAKKISST